MTRRREAPESGVGEVSEVSLGQIRSRYRVLRGMNYPTDAAVILRLRAGEHVPMAERTMRRADPGDIVDDIPTTSIPWLLARGAIEEVTGDGPAGI